MRGAAGRAAGANGAIYTIRHDLFVPIPTNTTVDDFVIPLLAKMKSGCAIVFEGDALAPSRPGPTSPRSSSAAAASAPAGFRTS